MPFIKTDLLATDQYELVEQNLDLWFSDTYTQQVPRLRLKTNNNILYNCISLWSERFYMLNVDCEKIEVLDPHAWNIVLMEERFDLHLSWAQVVSISYATRLADGVKVLPPTLAQSTNIKYPIYIPTIPRILDALLDQARYRSTYAENFLGSWAIGQSIIYKLLSVIFTSRSRSNGKDCFQSWRSAIGQRWKRL